MMKSIIKALRLNSLLVFSAVVLCASPLAALAQSPMDITTTSSTDVVAASQDSIPVDETHPAIHMTPDKSEIVRLNRDVRTLIVGNPSHLNVLMDSSRALVLVPRDPGATHFTALDEDGRVIMQRYVIVGIAKDKYVRIRRSCAIGGGVGCQETSVYYCPDMCHETGIVGSDSGQPPVLSSMTGGSLSISDITSDDDIDPENSEE